jgi:hypothetical protein
MPRSLTALLLAAAATLACASSASAAVTATAITSPSPTAIYPVWDPLSPGAQTTQVGGTATGSGPVRFWCDAVGPDGSVIAGSSLTQNPVQANGPFTADLRLSSQSPAVNGCRLVALPADGLPADLSPFRGPLMFRQTDSTYKVASGPNTGTAWDFLVALGQRRSYAEVRGIASCGLCGLAVAEDDRAGQWSWWDVSWLDGFRTDPSRTAAMVDGRKTLFPSDLYATPWAGYENLPGITDKQVTTASETSAGRVSASEEAVHCTTDVVSSGSGFNREPDPSTCAALVPAGVRFDRSSTPLDANGRSWRVTDVIHSVDGRAHELDLVYRNEVGWFDEPRLQIPWAADTGWRPWPTERRSLGVPATGLATIYTQFDSSRPQGLENPIGALVAGPGVSEVTLDVEQGLTVMTHYRQTVPANGSVTIEQAAIAGLSEAETHALAAQAEAALTPQPGPPRPPTPPYDPPPAPPHVDPPAPPAPTPADTTKPQLSKLARTKAGFRATLSEPARLTIAISRRDPGRRAGRTCRKPSPKLRRAKPCTRLTRIGALTVSGRAGVNAIAFKNKVGRRALAAGSYVASFVARDAAGNASAPKTVAFKVAKAKPRTRG